MDIAILVRLGAAGLLAASFGVGLASCAEPVRGDPWPEVRDTTDTARPDGVAEVVDTSGDTVAPDIEGDGVTDVSQPDEETPPPPLSFADDGVHQVLMVSCASSGCHGTGAGGYSLTGTVGTDYSNTLNTVTPGDGANSRLLKKATNASSHAGGPIFDVGTPDYELVLEWINGGANP